MSIYKKIRKSKRTALKKTETQSVMGNAFEAVAAGGRVVSDQEKSKDKEGGGSGGNGIGQIVKMAGMLAGGGASPITYKSSALRKNGEPKVEKKIVNYKGTAHDYIRTNVNKPAVTGGYTGGGTFKNQEEKDWYDAEIKKRVDSGMSNEQAIQDYRDTFKIGDKKPDTPGSSSANVTLTPRTEVQKTEPSQEYNMSFKNVENANWAEGAKRRGTRRAERRANRDIRRYEEGSKGFLGIGKGKGKGELSANVIAAAEKTGKTIKGVNYDAEGNITGDKDQEVTDQMRSRAKNLSMNKYGFGLNEFGNKKPGSSKTVAESGEGYEVYDGPVGDFTPNSASNIDFSQYGMKDYAGEFEAKTNKLLEGLPSFSGPTKKGKLGKNAKAFKNKAGRGAGY